MRNKYHNYNPHPVKKIGGHDSEIWENYGSGCGGNSEKKQKREKNRAAFSWSLIYTPGVRKEEVLKLAASLGADHILDMETCRKSERERLNEFGDYITDDRVFGVICHKKLKDFYDSEKLEAMKKEVEASDGMTDSRGYGSRPDRSGQTCMSTAISRDGRFSSATVQAWETGICLMGMRRL